MVVSRKFSWKVKGTWLLGRCSSRKILSTCINGTSWLFTIYLGKQVGPRFRQMISKIQDWWILSWNRVYHLYKSVPFTKKRPRRPQTGSGIQDGLEEMECKLSLGRFYLEKQDYLFRCSVAPGDFLLERPKKSYSWYFPTRFSGNVL